MQHARGNWKLLASFSQEISRCRVGDLGLNLGTIRTRPGETAVWKWALDWSVSRYVAKDTWMESLFS